MIYHSHNLSSVRLSKPFHESFYTGGYCKALRPKKAFSLDGNARYIARFCADITRSISWWRHQMEAFSALLVLCAGNPPVPGDFPAQRPVTQSFDVFFYLHPNERLSKQSWGWWFETPWLPLWRHSNILHNTHNRHIIAHPWGRGMICLIWVPSDRFVLGNCGMD